MGWRRGKRLSYLYYPLARSSSARQADLRENRSREARIILGGGLEMKHRSSGRARGVRAAALTMLIATASCSSSTEPRSTAAVGGLALSITIFPSPAAIGDTVVAMLTVVNMTPHKITRAFGAVGPHMRVESSTQSLGPSPFPPRFFLDLSNVTIIFNPHQNNLIGWMYSAVAVGDARITACVPTEDVAPSDSVCVSDVVHINSH
jgi:hypothetical protein